MQTRRPRWIDARSTRCGLARAAQCLVVAAALAGCGGAPDDSVGFVEDHDPIALTWVSPGATLFVGEPIALAVATQAPSATVVHFAVDGAEVGACDASDPDDDCYVDGLFQWAAVVTTPGTHTLVASAGVAGGATLTATQTIDVAPTAPADDMPEGSDAEPDPLDTAALVDEGTGEIEQGITAARGYLDASSPLHSRCGGERWQVTGQRVVLASGARIDGSTTAVARCMAAQGASVQRYADLRYVSRASVVAQLVRAGNCGEAGWRSPVLPAALCAAVAPGVSRQACRARMVASPDFAIDVLTRYLALASVRAFDGRDPPRMAIALEGRTRATCSRRDAWHLLESRAGSISAYVAAYNAYRTWERRGMPTTSKVPAEFVARTYVEALGRAPDQTGWSEYTSLFRTQGCSAATLRRATDVFLDAEFLALPYSSAQRVLALYRGALGREPDAAGLARYGALLDANPGAWSSVVAAFESTAEYEANVASICDATRANYHPEATHPALAIGPTLTASQLQAELDAAPAGGVVELPASALVVADAPLVVPAGVTLQTAGAADGLAGRRAYARLGRIVRGAPFDAPLVRLRAGATLAHVWLDGRRMQWPTMRVADAQNVFVEPSASAASTVRWVRSDNPLGPQNVRFGGSSDPGGCAAAMSASENLVGNYSNDNRLPGGIWADGIFTLCENTTVERNEVIDASDVALIAFFSMNATPQHSRFVDNTVLSAGNDAFAALGTDPWSGAHGSCTGDCDFTGTLFDRNTIFSGPTTRFVVGISAGTRAWSFISPHGNGRGARYTNNTAGQARVRVQLAVYVSGMLDAQLADNWDPATIDYATEPSVPANRCGTGATEANATYASGALQGARSVDHDDCI